jgi:hypothetical protein
VLALDTHARRHAAAMIRDHLLDVVQWDPLHNVRYFQYRVLGSLRAS